MILRRLQLGVLRAAVVQHLNLHADIRRITLERSADADAVVGVLGQLELEPQDEVGVFLLGEEVAAVFLRREEDAVLDLITLAGLVLGAVGAACRRPSRSGPCR